MHLAQWLGMDSYANFYSDILVELHFIGSDFYREDNPDIAGELLCFQKWKRDTLCSKRFSMKKKTIVHIFQSWAIWLYFENEKTTSYAEYSCAYKLFSESKIYAVLH